MRKRLLISLYLSAIKIKACMPFFEELHSELLQYGVELNLLNFSRTTPRTDCRVWDFENPPFKADSLDESGFPGNSRWGELLDTAVRRDTPPGTKDPAGIEQQLTKQSRLFFLWLDYIKPDFVFLWHQFRGLHFIAARILSGRNIPFGFTHLGCLPGTIVLERGGEMGESWVSREYQRFRSLPVSETDLEEAKKYMEYVVSNKIDRKPLTEEGQIDDLLNSCRARGKRIVFYAGQNDRYAGLVPYDEVSRKFHSPYYTGTYDALVHLDKIAGRNNGVILFKPHPNEAPNLPRELNLSNTYAVPGANIFDCIYLSDLTVTILSTTSYLSRLHGKPTVMLGRHQISGKGCVYEINGREEAETVISRALVNGYYSPQMKRAWRIHIAQLLKYYLFFLHPHIRFAAGRGAKAASQYILDSLANKNNVEGMEFIK